MEVTMSFGMTEEKVLFIEAVIEDNFTDRFDTDSLNKIQEVTEEFIRIIIYIHFQTVQKYLGGYWSIQFYDDPYMFFSTSFKRSPSFIVLDVNGKGVAVVKDR
ncbi:hypothetical protein CRE_23816 [Caenorhabditis remanei]|uniref:Uncharacterized protein n=1 Tax=Caenorhabditis remanei TaxID=31234 RepID=E3NR42_CAERE|nr:hypothetical protein CRE_23816 [Caenorhabditis remanei]